MQQLLVVPGLGKNTAAGKRIYRGVAGYKIQFQLIKGNKIVIVLLHYRA